ncbi:MAG TPA: prepilin-type N-terminal cleavage/methylation domain-containing protein [Candidatus Nitrosotenuis sp.]|nr:prepilin-type N-terminal cleavage/methylation domain-containing protein [Candidatus Nitrosotenuis sp.]
MVRHVRGFTLIELMIVIALIAILAAILIPNMVRSRNQAKLSSCKQSIRALASALETYATANGGRYPTSLSLLPPDCIKAVPTCPVTQSSLPYTSGYQFSTNPDSYTLMCATANHTVVGLPPNFPQYESSTGLHDQP